MSILEDTLADALDGVATDDSPACEGHINRVACDQPATLRLTLRPCGCLYLFCAPHADKYAAGIAYLIIHHPNDAGIHPKDGPGCGAVFTIRQLRIDSRPL
jgi:hypothetical protein